MARPQRRRRICREPEYRHFQPDGIADREEVNLTCDEFEIIRLVDHLGLTHEQAAKRMDISRTTATEVYESARKKIAEAIVTGKSFTIGGGSYRLCPGDGCENRCGPSVPPISDQPKGENTMRIAVTYENGGIFQHFGEPVLHQMPPSAAYTSSVTESVPKNRFRDSFPSRGSLLGAPAP